MHLEEIAFHVAPGARADLLLDQAGWHGSAELIMPDSWLSNRIFKSCDDIVDHCCFAWTRPAGEKTVATHLGGCREGQGDDLDMVLRMLAQRLGIEEWMKQTTRQGVSRG